MGNNIPFNFEAALDRHLKKCEIEFRAKQINGGHEIEWLAPYCDTLEHIVEKLRELGFKIARIVDEETAPGELMRWVETTSGIIVYANDKYCKGLAAKAPR